jgi:hypothetical protein
MSPMPAVQPMLDLDDSVAAASYGGRSVTIGRREVNATPVFDAYWRFAAERQSIFFRRLDGVAGELTNDPVLQGFKFTNAYRASDRVSQYLIKNVIYRDDLPSDETNVFFRILLFKLFNKIETWTTLEKVIGPITWEAFGFKRFEAILSREMARGNTVYSAAYIMPSGGGFFGHQAKHQNHLRMLEHVIRERFPARLRETKCMADAFSLLRSIPFVGPFLAYQYVTDLNYSELTDFGEDEFVVAGPGALDGISKCFQCARELNPADVIRYMYENQEQHFTEQGIAFRTLWGRRLQLIDCQNLFCEISKYARVAFPAYAGVAGRTRIKQKFESNGALPEPWYPPKWKIDATQPAF